MTLPEPVQKWIKALRSGEYKQGQKRLCVIDRDKSEKYCCLGVACELYMKEFPEKLHREEHNINGIVRFHNYFVGEKIETYEDWSVSLPPMVQEWLGLKDDYGGYVGEDDYVGKDFPTSLTKYNDVEKYTFNQIADIIERDYELMAKGA
jgi:hypothetical protein